MFAKGIDLESPFVLKQLGEFEEALWAYMDLFAKALYEGNEYIAQMCFDQLLDIRLLQYLRAQQQFGSSNRLKDVLNRDLTSAVQEKGIEAKTKDYFERAWGKFTRGKPVYSVRKDQLVS